MDYIDFGDGCLHGTEMMSDLEKSYWYKVSITKTGNNSKLAVSYFCGIIVVNIKQDLLYNQAIVMSNFKSQ